MAQRKANPYRPGFNQPPTRLSGREPVLAAAREALEVAALDARTPRPLVLVGSRGVGKTVVLGEIAALAAEEHSWPTAAVEVRPNVPFTGQLVHRLHAVADLFDQVQPGRRLEITAAKVRAIVLGVGGEISVGWRAREEGRPLPVEQALARACESALQHDGGLVLTLDELQLAGRDELADLAAALQQHVPDGWPLVVVAAGLPGVRGARHSVTYLERAEWHELGLLDPAATREALVEPAASAGRPFADDAVQPLVDASGGYPYAIQVVGHYAWRASAGADRITRAHSESAVEAAEQDLATGLYVARWQDASPKEREYLRALARLSADQPDVTGADVAAALGRPSSAVSYLRDRLLKKGTLFAEGRYLRFLAPGMAGWIGSRDEPG